MEIPYVVTPRKDTGLFNSKIGIWLFLASEVMLFGGFFSAYVFLRIYADFPWPERTLPVLPGLINTFVLIGSSVTVVFAWAGLKLRRWNQFRLCMGTTVACALVFLALKAVEYNVKLHHQAVRLKDYTILEGHLDKEQGESGRVRESNLIRFETATISFNTTRFEPSWIEEILAQATKAGAKVGLAEDLKFAPAPGAEPVTVHPAGTALTLPLMQEIRQRHLASRSNNSDVRTAELRKAWHAAKAGQPDTPDWQMAAKVNADEAVVQARALTEAPAVTFKVEPPFAVDWQPKTIQQSAEQAHLKDGTLLTGKLLDSPMEFHAVDAIDFRHLAMKAKQRGLDPDKAIEASWLLQDKEMREIWDWHKQQVAAKEKELLDGYGTDKNGNPKRVPTATERYRVGWKDLVAKAQDKPVGGANTLWSEEFTGPNYPAREKIHAFPHFAVPRDQIAFESKFTPAWNTYYAIYFTMTGLHGLHVIGGALVLAYYLFFGKAMYRKNPEWLANRVEIGGLFWHFVDLVWIFLFPILYLM